MIYLNLSMKSKKLTIQLGIFGLLIVMLVISTALVKKVTNFNPKAAELATTTSSEDNLPAWRLIFSDDFNTDVSVGGFSGCVPKQINNNPYQVDFSNSNCNGLPLAVQKKWFAYPDGWPDGSPFGAIYYPSRVISIADGTMNVKLHSEKVNGKWIHMISTLVPKIPNQPGPEGGQIYGRYAIRFKIDPPITGYKFAWLLWPDSEIWPKDGEIDFPEADDFSLKNKIYGGVHWAENNQDKFTIYPSNTTPADGSWHTAETDWTKESIKFILDGKVIGNFTDKANIPNKPMTWRIQSQGMLWQAVEPKNTDVVNIKIDWVKVWQKVDSKSSPSLLPRPSFSPTPSSKPPITPWPSPSLKPSPSFLPRPSSSPTPSSKPIIRSGQIQE